MNITSGKIQTAQKVVVYGPEGIGKSTFAARFPNPLFIDTEGSTKNMDVRRFDKPTSWAMINAQINYVKANPTVCKTLVIDTIDWAEQFCISEICSKHNKKGIEDFGFGNGYVYEKEEFGRFLNSLEEVVERGINIVLTAHAQLRKFEQPDELGAYDRWELKLGKKTSSQISPLIKEWADMVLFANYETFAVQADDKGKKFKAQGGNRVMYTAHHPCWDAKNRQGLQDKLPFDYTAIAHIFNGTAPAAVSAPAAPVVTPPPSVTMADIEEIIDEAPTEQPAAISSDIPIALRDLMTESKVTEADVRQAVASKGYYPADTPITNYDVNFINAVLVAAWPQVYKIIQANKALPF